MVSVIVPAYNAESYIENCLKSISNQTCRDIEIIVVDDGSKDKTQEICENFAKEEERLFVYSLEKNSGVSTARNYGISKAHGEYIMFVDADDSMHETYVEVLLNNILSTGADISVCSCTFDTDDLGTGSGECSVIDIEKLLELTFFTHFFPKAVFAKLYRKELVEGLQFMPELRIGEDQVFIFEYFCKCKTCACQQIKLYYYNRGNSSAMRSAFDKRRYDSLYKANLIYEMGVEKFPHLESRFYKVKIRDYVRISLTGFGTKDSDGKKILSVAVQNVKESDFEKLKPYFSKREKVEYILVKYFTPILKIYGLVRRFIHKR